VTLVCLLQRDRMEAIFFYYNGRGNCSRCIYYREKEWGPLFIYYSGTGWRNLFIIIKQFRCIYLFIIMLGAFEGLNLLT
jgi:hypothetical protein